MAKIDLSNIAITKNQKDSPLSNVDPKKTVDYARTLREKNVKSIDYARVGQGVIDFAKTLLGGVPAKKKGEKATIDESKIRKPIPLESTRRILSKANQGDIDKLSALSGGNTNWTNRFERVPYDSPNSISKNKVNALKDIMRFFQSEFKVTPRADISSYPDEMDIANGGETFFIPTKTGQHDVNLRFTSSRDDDTENDYLSKSDYFGWSPKNSYRKWQQYIPVHELAHALSSQLLNDDVFTNNAMRRSDGKILVNSYRMDEDELYERADDNMRQLVYDSAKDIGMTSGKNITKAISGISGYAEEGGAAETVAEAVGDYYVNGKNASPLSLAIVNRLKRYGSTYGLRQAGGVRKRYETPEETLRRYKVIQ